MSRPSAYHLSPDAVDLWLEIGALPPAEQGHVDACQTCRELLRAERAVVDQLAALRSYAPTLGFEERVMAAVHLPDPFALRRLRAIRRRVFATRRSMAVAATLALAVVGSMAASVAWSLANPELLAAAGDWVLAQGGALLWDGVRTVASNVLEQPWFDAVRDAVGSPGRAAVAAVAATLLYLSGLLALRRLLALPAPRVADARF